MKNVTKWSELELQLMKNLIEEAQNEAAKIKLVNLWLTSQGGKDEMGSEVADAKVVENNKYLEIVKQKRAFFENLLK